MTIVDEIMMSFVSRCILCETGCAARDAASFRTIKAKNGHFITEERIIRLFDAYFFFDQSTRFRTVSNGIS